MSELQNQNANLSSSGVDFVLLCEDIVQRIEEVLKGRNLLNEKQCRFLAGELSVNIACISEVVDSCGKYKDAMVPLLAALHRYYEKAEVLVNQCAEEDWCAAAVFQDGFWFPFWYVLDLAITVRNEVLERAKNYSSNITSMQTANALGNANSIRAGLVYNSQFDTKVLQHRLHDLSGLFSPEQAPLKQQHLARYLLKKHKFQTEYTTPKTLSLEVLKPILWEKENEPAGTWGNLSFLGAGSKGSGVLKTTWLGVPCAKKEYHGFMDYDGIFVKEALIMAQLKKHPCIVKFISYGNGEEKGDPFITMELMEKSLLDLIKDRKGVHFSLDVALDIIWQIVNGVRYLHENGVAHCDLKPHNVVVTTLRSPYHEDYYCVKLVDFGTATSEGKISVSNALTIQGIGTTRYRAPELHRRAYRGGLEKVNWFKADAYSFAMTCVHILTLEAPFVDMTSSNLYIKLLEGERPILPSGCPKELVDLLEECWSTKRWRRPEFDDIYFRLKAIIFSNSSVHISNRENFLIPSSRISNIPTLFQEIKAGNMSKVQERNAILSSSEIDFVQLCVDVVQRVEEVVKRGKVLNARHCEELATKLSSMIGHIRVVVECCGTHKATFTRLPAALYRYYEKAEALVKQCGVEDWCAAAVFQPNTASFFYILDHINSVGVEILKCAKKYSSNITPLQSESSSSSVLETISTILHQYSENEDELRKELDGLESDLLMDSMKHSVSPLPEEADWRRLLARYLSKKKKYQSGFKTLSSTEALKLILWEKDYEPTETWKIISFLAGSEEGGVLKASWLGVPCARKEFHVKAFEPLFVKEVLIMARLKHPCIVDFMCCGIGDVKGDRFIAMELMEKSLYDLIKERNGVLFSVDVALDIIWQISEGVKYLHDNNVAHRDLKPQNVVVNTLRSTYHEDYYYVKLVDFGVSKSKVEATESFTVRDRGVGTTRYRAPEAHPKEVGRKNWFKADAYSFSMTCAHILTLQEPFVDFEIADEIHAEVRTGGRPPLPSGCPEELVNLLEECWSIGWQKRPKFDDISSRLKAIVFENLQVPTSSMEFFPSSLKNKVVVDESERSGESAPSSPRNGRDDEQPLGSPGGSMSLLRSSSRARNRLNHMRLRKGAVDLIEENVNEALHKENGDTGNAGVTKAAAFDGEKTGGDKGKAWKACLCGMTRAPSL